MSLGVFKTLHAKMAFTAPGIEVRPDSIRSGAVGKVSQDEEGMDVEKLSAENFGKLILDLPTRVVFPEWVTSRIDNIENEFQANYTNRPFTVLGLEKSIPAERVRKPSREFLRVMNEFRFHRDVIEEEEEEERRRSIVQLLQSPKGKWGIVRAFFEAARNFSAEGAIRRRRMSNPRRTNTAASDISISTNHRPVTAVREKFVEQLSGPEGQIKSSRKLKSAIKVTKREKSQSNRLKELAKNGKELTEAEVKEANQILYQKYLASGQNGSAEILDEDYDDEYLDMGEKAK